MDTPLTSSLPHGFAVATSPAGAAGIWDDVIALARDRTGVVVGSCADADHAFILRTEILAGLRDTADPLRFLTPSGRNGFGVGTAPGTASVMCMVIDRGSSRIACAGLGDGAIAIAEGDRGQRVLLTKAGRRMESALDPGATVVLIAGRRSADACASPADYSGMRPQEAADRVIDGLPSGHTHGIVVVVYRHPPAALSLTVAADPHNLAFVRAELRRWLASAAVDPENSADALLAVGEAASNSAEHAVLAAGRSVQVTVEASISAGQLRFEVSDNGQWRTPPASSGHRGHGIRLINALVDRAELTTTNQGTTVHMLKELRA